MLESLIGLQEVKLFLALVFLELLLVKHDLLAEIRKEFRILLALLHLLRLFLFAVLVDLTDNGGEQLFLVGLARIKFDSLSEALACASLNEG